MIATKRIALHVAVLGLLLALHYVLPPYHHGNLARIMVLATYAIGFNLVFGYTGLLSLGHAMFFAAGMYASGLGVLHFGLEGWQAMLAGPIAAGLLGLAVGALALRTTGVQFMIVTLMLAQAGYLTILYFNDYTLGEEGFVIDSAARMIAGYDLSLTGPRYIAALILFGTALMVSLAIVTAPFGRVLVAIRENEDRTRMLGFSPFRYKLIAVVISATISGAAGAAYAILFGYVGASFAASAYSILPLLWVLVGGPGTTLGALLGTVLMFYLIDYASGSWMPWLAEVVGGVTGTELPGLASAYMLLVGLVLILGVLYAPRGLLGTVRARALPWLP